MKRLKEKYKEEIISKMKEKFGYKNNLSVPKPEMVVVNVGFGKILQSVEPSQREKLIQDIFSDLASICGQKLILTRSKKSIATFKIRKGSPVGGKVTLRGGKMYDFLDRLINLALPRTRDFQGLKESSIDGRGNLTIGIKEHIVFPEIQPEQTKKIFGFEITIVTNAKKREEALELFKLMGFPFKVSK
jgi:large subunit ribosomal protein L5